jgi:hypothetical protein
MFSIPHLVAKKVFVYITYYFFVQNHLQLELYYSILYFYCLNNYLKCDCRNHDDDDSEQP